MLSLDARCRDLADLVRGLQRLPCDAAKNSEYRFPRGRFNQRKKYDSASSPCAKEVPALRDPALKEFVLRTTLFPTTEQLHCSLNAAWGVGCIGGKKMTA